MAEVFGVPHAFRCIFDETADDYTDRFLVSQITDQDLALVLEDWDIWTRWKASFDVGSTTLDTHPALPADRSRHEEIAIQLANAFMVNPGCQAEMRASFRRIAGEPVPDGVDEFEVEWSKITDHL
ncbi:hypothetical protein [Bryocella elongata]|uniref:hypothetical protein n=1 Tax=Bryocella elongata TaxID=863522 RepID=UPI0011B0E215|nr:hypothetical protein [Bryocella elongata]